MYGGNGWLSPGIDGSDEGVGSDEEAWVMAGDWIPWDHDLPDKQEVLAVVAKTNESLAEVLLALCRLWCWFDRHTEDGRMRNITVTGVTLRCGKCDDFWRAVSSEGWLEFDGYDVVIPKFAERFGRSARSRLLTAKRMRRLREKTQRNNSDADVTQQASHVTRPRTTTTIKENTPIAPLDLKPSEVVPCLPVHLRSETAWKLILSVMEAAVQRGKEFTDLGLAAVQWAALHGSEAELSESAGIYLANQNWKKLINYSDPKYRKASDGKGLPRFPIPERRLP